LEEATELGPLINRGGARRVHTYKQVGLDEGASLLTGGEPSRGGLLLPADCPFADVDP